MVQSQQATLLSVIPKSAERTDIQLIRMAPKGIAVANGDDRVAEELRQAGDADAVPRSTVLDREFFAWYWSLMSTD